VRIHDDHISLFSPNGLDFRFRDAGTLIALRFLKEVKSALEASYGVVLRIAKQKMWNTIDQRFV